MYLKVFFTKIARILEVSKTIASHSELLLYAAEGENIPIPVLYFVNFNIFAPRILWKCVRVTKFLLVRKSQEIWRGRGKSGKNDKK